MTKRRFIEQLPNRLRTEDLKKFFSATVDHVFQPGRVEPVSGYIGRYPSYYDAKRDFYITEPTPERATRQLEPTMVTASALAISRVLFYDDLVRYISASGGITNDESRLFDTEYYSWAPPLDIGKINSPHNYYWFGDDPTALPGLLLTPPARAYYGNNVTSTFALPETIEGITSEHEEAAVLLDGLEVSFTRTGDNVSLAASPKSGQLVEVYRYGNLRKAITGRAAFDPTPFRSPKLHYLGTGSRTEFALPRTVEGYVSDGTDLSVTVDGAVISNEHWDTDGTSVTFRVAPAANAEVVLTRYRDHAKTVKALINGMRAVFNDTLRLSGYDTNALEIDPWDDAEYGNSYIVDGVGAAIEFLRHDRIWHTAPLYTVCDRRSRDRNPWSTSNMWVHREAFAWAHQLFTDRVARRPIIEFNRDLELFNFGRTYIGSVDRVLSTNGIGALGYDTEPFDTKAMDFGELDSVTQINGRPSGSVLADDDLPIHIGHRILIRHVVEDNELLSTTVARIVPYENEDGETVMMLDPEDTEVGDIVNVRDGFTFYHHTGEEWVLSQSMDDGAAPLFALYDSEQTSLADAGFYKDFAGSKIFSYAVNTDNRADTVLGLQLRYDALGQIVFENLLTTQVIEKADGTTMPGRKFYRVLGETLDTDRYQSDWHVIDTPSEAIGGQVPPNLQANPNNGEIDFISRNEWLDHFKAIVENQVGFEGDALGFNNWDSTARELTAVGFSPLRILQHKAPLLKTMLLANDKSFDLLESIRYVEQEYGRFRNRFIQSVNRAYLDGHVRDNDAAATIVRHVLTLLKQNKNAEFPFALSTLGDVAGKETFFIPPTPAALGVLAATQPGLEVDHSLSVPITYLRGHDGSRMPLFGDTLNFGGDGATKDFVLPTEPLGPVTVTISGVVQTNVSVSGKIVTLNTAPANGSTIEVKIADIRDRALLALEEAIYDSLPSAFRSEAARPFELITWVDGAFRDTGDFGYRASELNRVLTPMFLRWVQKNGFDYRVNNGYEQSDPFTWNYSQSLDRNGEYVPGHWRGIYLRYYDTDRPHLAPWEMLGFAAEPSWWSDQYGEAPYTSGLTAMWEDLRDGRIAQGERAGIDTRYARPELLDVLPVDEWGDLLDPMATGIIPTAPTFHQATRGWVIGDVGPVEYLWRQSPSFPFALAEASFLLKPARFVEQNWDTINDGTANGQWIHRPLGARISNSELTVHGETDENGVRQPKTGIQQWIAERMISLGQDVASFGDAVRELGVRLAHKMAGYTKGDDLRVVADNFGLVPQEDVNIFLYSSPSYKQEFYSGVIVEWSGTGWRVFGYDALNPAFTIELSDPASARSIVTISDIAEPVILTWKPNVHYAAGHLVDYKSSVYQCMRSHTSTQKFEQDFWEARPNLRVPEAPRVTKYSLGTGETVTIPYGTEFQTYQELADFIFGHERYLESRGWLFDNEDNSVPRDWTQAMRDFLEWASMQWEPGYFIALSPGAIGLKFHTDHGMIYSLEQAFNGAYGIVNRDGLPINQRDTFVSRIDGEVTLRSKFDDIYGARLHVGEVEHALVFSNETIFSDLIYKPLFDLRQPRLRVVGHRAADWNGRFDAPGYIIGQDGIISNFDRAAEDIRDAFDIEGSGSKPLRDHARHLVGYESRSYLRDLLLSDTQQFEFYQGLIQQKGSAGTFGKLLRSQFIEQDRNLKFLEEWAFKTSSFGALDATKRYAFDLWQSHIERNPQLVRFKNIEVTDSPDDVHYVGTTGFISGADRLPHVFPVRESYKPQPGDLPSAGYARLNEVHYTAFNHDGVINLYRIIAATNGGKALADGERVWVYDGTDHEWEVLRSTDLSTDGNENRIVRIEPAPTGRYGAIITLERDHGLTDADRGMLVVFDGETRSNVDIAGVQRVFKASSNQIEIETNVKLGYRWIAQQDDTAEIQSLETANDPENAPKVRALRRTRFANKAALDAASLGWFSVAKKDELAYIDIDPEGSLDNPRWVVRRHNGSSWTAVHRVQPKKIDSTSIVGSLVYDTTSKFTSRNLISEPLLIDRLVVVDPLSGLIPGEAERELTYKLEHDPARYNRGSAGHDGAWTAEHAGELWWDLSTVRFLTAETDEAVGTARIEAEQRYRADNWGKVAPGASVDVYEWTRSFVPPIQYSGDGQIYRPNAPSWVETEEFDSALNRLVPVYYFWVKNKREVNRTAKGRRHDSRTVARIIENSTGLDLPWISPAFTDGLLVGGVSQFLTEGSTVLQLDVRLLSGDSNVHTEWTLLRPEDSRSQPPAPLWDKMIDSLAGRDRFKRAVPDPALNRHAAQGIEIRPRQSLFGGTFDERETLGLARESMVGMLNRIFAREDVVRQRVGPIQNLLGLADRFPTRNETDSTPAVLAWSAKDAHESSLPSQFEYDFQVYSRNERDALLVGPDFSRARAEGRKMRVLINGLEAVIPFWSVWEYDPANDSSADDDERLENADELFNLAPAYDLKVSDRAGRDALVTAPATLPAGRVVLVVEDSSAQAFWTLWRYDPTNPLSDAKGFFLIRAQDYRVSDFVELTDWYAEGYGPSNPPVISFPDRVARDNALGNDPVTTFVRIDDDGAEEGSGWMWTVFADGQWKTVARELRTIRIKPEIFERLALPESSTAYGVGARKTFEWDISPWDITGWETDLGSHTLTNIGTRDGALEVRALLKHVIADVLTEDEANEFFFSMVHFAHSRLDQVNWAFKTSFLYIGGYNEALIQMPVQRADNTESLLSYIDEVKPYRVKTRDFARGLAPPIDVSNAEVTDFDKPVYFDKAQGRFRRLDPNTPSDVGILQTGVWARWYENYLKTGYDLGSYSPDTWNPVRRIKTRIMFDRVDGWVRPGETAPFYPYQTHSGTVSGSSGSFIVTTTTPFNEHITKDMRVVGTGIGNKAVILEVNSPTQITLSVPHTGPVSGPLHFIDNNAAKRIDDFYVAKFPGQREKNLETLLKMDFKGTITDGGLDSANLPNDVEVEGNHDGAPTNYHLNASVDGVPVLGLNDPKTAENRPEELVFLGHQDFVAINVHSTGQPGAPSQTGKFFDVSHMTGPTAVLSYSELAQSNDAIAVFRDGVRADPPVDYVIDQFKREIEVNLLHPDTTPVKEVSVHVFGLGGETRIVEQRFYTFGVGDTQDSFYVTPRAEPSSVEVLIDGEEVSATANWTTGQITIGRVVEEGEDVLINVRDASGAPIKVFMEELPYRADGIWQINNWSGNRPEAHALAIVELDGIRLTPPETKYLRVGSGFRWALIDNIPSTGSGYGLAEYDMTEWDVATADRALWNIFIDGVEYLGDVPEVSEVFDSLQDVISNSHTIEEQFCYWRGYIVCTDVEIITDDVVVIINAGHDYTIDRDGVLTVLNPPADTGQPRLRVTNFSHVEDIGIDTWTYQGRAEGAYPIYRPHAGEYLWVTVNGKKAVFDVDFSMSSEAMLVQYEPLAGWDADAFTSTTGNWDLSTWDTTETEWDVEPMREPVILFVGGHEPTDVVVISVFKKAPLRLPASYLAASIVPGKSIMQPIMAGGWDSEWDEIPFENEAPLTVETPLGLRAVSSMEGGWEYLRVLDGHRGILTSPLTPSSTSLQITLPDYSRDLFSDPWFMRPETGDAPGVVWINGERIEYSQIAEANGEVTLGGLVRSSRGTRIGEHEAGSQVIAAVKSFVPRNNAL